MATCGICCNSQCEELWCKFRPNGWECLRSCPERSENRINDPKTTESSGDESKLPHNLESLNGNFLASVEDTKQGWAHTRFNLYNT